MNEDEFENFGKTIQSNGNGGRYVRKRMLQSGDQWRRLTGVPCYRIASTE